jgi:hypothetical protein
MGLLKRRPERTGRGVRHHRPIKARGEAPTQSLDPRVDYERAPAPVPVPMAHRSAPPPTEVRPVHPSPAPVVASPSPEPARPAAAYPQQSAQQSGTPTDGVQTGSAETKYYNVASTSKLVGVLAAMEGPLSGELFGVGDGESVIGRDSGCQIVANSEWISRSHAKIVHSDGEFYVGPISSKNPTILNDDATEGSSLKDGDFLRLGRTTFRFRTLV